MAASRDSQAVLDLFERYYDRVFCFARRSLDTSGAEDIAQEVFIKLLGQTGVADREINCSYLIKVADNLIKRRYRRARRFDSYVEQQVRAHAHERRDSERTTTPADFSSDDFQQLSANEQAAIRMIVCQGLSYDEAATALGVKVSSVNNWKHRGIQRLRERRDAAEHAPIRPGDAARSDLLAPEPRGSRLRKKAG